MTNGELYSGISALAADIVAECAAREVKISTAESCTGGMISGAVTSVSGSSAVIELGVCSYSNRIKHELLRVDSGIFEKYTEYSVQCAEAMADGVRKLSGADFAVSTTGVAG
ncbi:MAG TPA: CinA family protein, partial [Ruminococcaceae bacterium]|nr:CinA family protein [Oscillospiraceae bacterium]